ncbi:fibronectin type III domain-containing protein [Gabonibacter chumensis]|uniref:fibronectin type III domain-containing protein n=1 Tax=Gabonibacter chumensis TaxID=2972474 RepID=UPI00257451E3|nr:fibronectin type III domain-containing protein [Gabonibacter chumensis]MCR9012323.1 fibronectin type III domain-containing protein [Gabonibacter chumensis]
MEKNVLKSFLFICLGLTITTLVFAGAKAIITAPSPPGKPSADNVTTTGCTLKYLPPENDGGAPVVAYDIEYKLISWGWDSWRDKGMSPTLEHTISDMMENTTAIFRVKAGNRMGKSEPSKVSNEVTFEDPF